MPDQATRRLREDHRLIAEVLGCFDIALIDSRASQRVEARVFAPFLEFFSTFVEGWHTPREEDCLFPCLRRCATNGCADRIAGLVAEHQRADRHVAMMLMLLEDADGQDEAGRDLFLEQARKFRDLMIAHVAAEDGEFFGRADEVIEGEQLDALHRALGATEDSPKVARGRALSEEILRTYGERAAALA